MLGYEWGALEIEISLDEFLKMGNDAFLNAGLLTGYDVFA